MRLISHKARNDLHNFFSSQFDLDITGSIMSRNPPQKGWGPTCFASSAPPESYLKSRFPVKWKKKKQIMWQCTVHCQSSTRLTKCNNSSTYHHVATFLKLFKKPNDPTVGILHPLHRIASSYLCRAVKLHMYYAAKLVPKFCKIIWFFNLLDHLLLMLLHLLP